MADSLLDNYNPLYDIHLRQYFALPHMQKHLRKIGLLQNDESEEGCSQNEIYARHHAMMDMMLKNRETQLAKLAELQKKLDAAEKIEICRRIRSGVTSPESPRRAKPSRSLSRGRRSGASRQRRSSTSTDDKDLVKRIESENTEPPLENPSLVYNRLSAPTGKYRYLHKLDDMTLSSYMEQLRRELNKLERFREVSFGPHSVARHQGELQQSWFFRRRSVSSKRRATRSTSRKRDEPVRVHKIKRKEPTENGLPALAVVGVSAAKASAAATTAASAPSVSDSSAGKQAEVESAQPLPSAPSPEIMEEEQRIEIQPEESEPVPASPAVTAITEEGSEEIKRTVLPSHSGQEMEVEVSSEPVNITEKPEEIIDYEHEGYEEESHEAAYQYEREKEPECRVTRQPEKERSPISPTQTVFESDQLVNGNVREVFHEYAEEKHSLREKQNSVGKLQEEENEIKQKELEGHENMKSLLPDQEDYESHLEEDENAEQEIASRASEKSRDAQSTETGEKETEEGPAREEKLQSEQASKGGAEEENKDIEEVDAHEKLKLEDYSISSDTTETPYIHSELKSQEADLGDAEHEQVDEDKEPAEEHKRSIGDEEAKETEVLKVTSLKTEVENSASLMDKLEPKIADELETSEKLSGGHAATERSDVRIEEEQQIKTEIIKVEETYDRSEVEASFEGEVFGGENDKNVQEKDGGEVKAETLPAAVDLIPEDSAQRKKEGKEELGQDVEVKDEEQRDEGREEDKYESIRSPKVGYAEQSSEAKDEDGQQPRQSLEAKDAESKLEEGKQEGEESVQSLKPDVIGKDIEEEEEGVKPTQALEEEYSEKEFEKRGVQDIESAVLPGVEGDEQKFEETREEEEKGIQSSEAKHEERKDEKGEERKDEPAELPEEEDIKRKATEEKLELVEPAQTTEEDYSEIKFEKKEKKEAQSVILQFVKESEQKLAETKQEGKEPIRSLEAKDESKKAEEKEEGAVESVEPLKIEDSGRRAEEERILDEKSGIEDEFESGETTGRLTRAEELETTGIIGFVDQKEQDSDKEDAESIQEVQQQPAEEESAQKLVNIQQLAMPSESETDDQASHIEKTKISPTEDKPEVSVESWKDTSVEDIHTQHNEIGDGKNEVETAPKGIAWDTDGERKDGSTGDDEFLMHHEADKADVRMSKDIHLPITERTEAAADDENTAEGTSAVSISEPGMGVSPVHNLLQDDEPQEGKSVLRKAVEVEVKSVHIPEEKYDKRKTEVQIESEEAFVLKKPGNSNRELVKEDEKGEMEAKAPEIKCDEEKQEVVHISDKKTHFTQEVEELNSAERVTREKEMETGEIIGFFDQRSQSTGKKEIGSVLKTQQQPAEQDVDQRLIGGREFMPISTTKTNFKVDHLKRPERAPVENGAVEETPENAFAGSTGPQQTEAVDDSPELASTNMFAAAAKVATAVVAHFSDNLANEEAYMDSVQHLSSIFSPEKATEEMKAEVLTERTLMTDGDYENVQQNRLINNPAENLQTYEVSEERLWRLATSEELEYKEIADFVHQQTRSIWREEIESIQDMQQQSSEDQDAQKLVSSQGHAASTGSEADCQPICAETAIGSAIESEPETSERAVEDTNTKEIPAQQRETKDGKNEVETVLEGIMLSTDNERKDGSSGDEFLVHRDGEKLSQKRAAKAARPDLSMSKEAATTEVSEYQKVDKKLEKREKNVNLFTLERTESAADNEDTIEGKSALI